MIDIKNLTKKYGDFPAVNNINISVPANEIFGFIGPNGAGKTTTIKMIGGILAPTSGSVTICGIDMKDEPEKAKNRIGFIPDRPYIYEKLTGKEFLKFTADLYGVKEDDFEKESEEKLKLFTLMDWSNELIESYSHGMKQRLIMAAALIHDPKVIIIDEPMVGLDPIAIKLVKDLFKNLSGLGVSIFMSTHTLKVAEDICHRIGVIHKGSLIAVGTAEELKDKADASSADLEQIFINLTCDLQE